MSEAQIQSIADVRRIESEPYERFMPHRNLHEALTTSADRWPTRPALIHVLDDDLERPARTWSFAEFLDEVRRSANLFQAITGAEQPRVALLLPAIPEAHFALWGAECVGVACPLNYLLNADHLVHLVRAACCNVLVALADGHGLELADKVRVLQDECPGLLRVLMVGGSDGGSADFDSERAKQAPTPPAGAPGRQPDDIVALFHTGGTTGKPKLAQHTHRNQLHSAAGAALMYGSTHRDRIVNGLPIFHVAGSLVFGLSTLMVGGAIVLPTLLGMRNAGYMGKYWAFAARERATLVTATPTGIATLMASSREDCDISGVRALLTGGAPLPNGLADAFEAEFGIPVRNTLGLTECAGVVSIEPFHSPRVAGSCGLHLPFVEVRLLDAQGRAASSGVLQLRGPNVSPGYTEVGRNAGVFEQGWLISGDLARIDESERLYVTGRAKDLIIRNSHNIDPMVIEEALTAHPGVAMGAAVGEPDEYAGEVPVAYVVAKPGMALHADELLAFITPRIAERPAVPKRIEVLGALPQTGVGKVYKPALRLLAVEHALRQKLEKSGLAGIQAHGEETAAGIGVRFVCEPGLEDAVGQLMRRFSIPWRLDVPQ